MKLLKSLSLAILLISSVAAVATVPYTFVDGTPANAAEVNANFTALSEEIEALQEQITALQAYAGAPAVVSLAGTYDVFSVEVDIDPGFGVAGKSSSGTVVLNADGTGSVNTIQHYRSLNFNVAPWSHSHTYKELKVDEVNSTNHTHTLQSTLTGEAAVFLTGVELRNQPESTNIPITWSLSGGVVTISAGGESANLVVAGGKILISGINDSEGQNGLNIWVRR